MIDPILVATRLKDSQPFISRLTLGLQKGWQDRIGPASEGSALLAALVKTLALTQTVRSAVDRIAR